MNFKLNYEGFETNLFSERFDDGLGGIMYRFKFDNNYGASIVKHKYSYGSNRDLWELAVLRFTEGDPKGYLTYDTPITNDVVGYLTDERVRDLLNKIKDL